MVPTAAAITLAAHAVGNAIILYHIFSPLLEHDAIDMVSLGYYAISLLQAKPHLIYPS